MIAHSVPGQGLPWPESVQAMVRSYGSPTEAAKVVGIRRRQLARYVQGTSIPYSDRVRQQFFAFGWSQFELPDRSRSGRRRVSDTDGPPRLTRNQQWQCLLMRAGNATEPKDGTTRASHYADMIGRAYGEMTLHKAMVSQMRLRGYSRHWACKMTTEAMARLDHVKLWSMMAT